MHRLARAAKVDKVMPQSEGLTGRLRYFGRTRERHLEGCPGENEIQWERVFCAGI